MSNWAELPQDIIRLIAQHVKLLEDYVAFTTVCNPWQAVATKENFRGLPLWQRIPCLMLAADKDSDYREFYNLFEDEVVAKVFLPETKGKKCMDASFGWFFTIGQSGETSLVNPSTRDQIDLPYQYIGDDYIYPWIFYEKALLSSSPCENPTDFVLMVSGSSGRDALYIWRPGDQLWTRATNCSRQFCDFMYYNNQFYGISWDARVVVFDIEGNNPEESRILAEFPYRFIGGETYIMESLGRCIVVLRHGIQVSSASERPNGYFLYNDPGPFAYGTTTFKVFDLDLIDGHKFMI